MKESGKVGLSEYLPPHVPFAFPQIIHQKNKSLRLRGETRLVHLFPTGFYRVNLSLNVVSHSSIIKVSDPCQELGPIYITFLLGNIGCS